MLLTGRMVFSDYTKKRILFYHAKGSHVRSHHTHAHSHHTHAHSHHAHAQSYTSLSLHFAYFFSPVPSDSLVVLLYRFFWCIPYMCLHIIGVYIQPSVYYRDLYVYYRDLYTAIYILYVYIWIYIQLSIYYRGLCIGCYIQPCI